MSVYGTGHFLTQSLSFCEKTETTNSPEIKIERDPLCDATTARGTQNAAVTAALVGRTSHCMPVPLEGARSFLDFSVKATQKC